jgi:AcrR family transcriptional regulator
MTMALDHVRRARGRPAQSPQKIEAIKSRIAEAALRLFQQEGYEAVSMRRLAAEVGCTVMTIYRYYDRKIDILRDLWAQIFDEVFNALDTLAQPHIDPAQRLEAISIGYVAFWLENRDHYFMVFMSSDIEQTDVSIFVQNDAVLARFFVFTAAISACFEDRIDDDALKIKGEVLLCCLHGIAKNLLTISAYPWSDYQALVRASIAGILVR